MQSPFVPEKNTTPDAFKKVLFQVKKIDLKKELTSRRTMLLFLLLSVALLSILISKSSFFGTKGIFNTLKSTPSVKSVGILEKKNSNRDIQTDAPEDKYQIKNSVDPNNLGFQGNIVSDSCEGLSWVYLVEEAIWHFCSVTNKKVRLFSGSYRIKWYLSPVFVDQNTISFQECTVDTTPTKGENPYSCSLVMHNLRTGESEVLFSNTSYLNSSLRQIGAELSGFAWSNNKKLVAFTRNTNPNKVGEENDEVAYLNLYNLSNKSIKPIGVLPVPDGRGRGLNDEVKIVFAPDDSKVLTQMLGRQTITVNGRQQYHEPVLVHIFDINNAQPSVSIWSNPNKFSTFSNFIDSNTILFKELSLPMYDQDTIFKLDLKSGEKKFISNADNWYGLKLLDKDNLLFWTQDPETKKTAIIQYDLNLLQPIKNWNDLVLIDVISQNAVLVGGGKRPIGNDDFNWNQHGVLRLDTNEVTLFESLPYSIESLDVNLP